MRIVTIFGGSGFVGRYITRQMAKDGWRVRVAVRRPNYAHFVRTYGVVGQVEPIQANILDETSTRLAITGADAVVNCVGILSEDPQQCFSGIHSIGAKRISSIASEVGVARMVHISAIGADTSGTSKYQKTKAEGELWVQDQFKDPVILRPSIIFGAEDQFFNRFARMAKLLPLLPLVGATTRFQPVYVDDVARSAALAVQGNVSRGIFELGGPEIETLSSLVDRVLACIRRHRIKLHLPFFVGDLLGFCLDTTQSLTCNLFHNSILTRDQVCSLRVDNIVSYNYGTFSELDINPVPISAVIRDYLCYHRSQG